MAFVLFGMAGGALLGGLAGCAVSKLSGAAMISCAAMVASTAIGSLAGATVGGAIGAAAQYPPHYQEEFTGSRPHTYPGVVPVFIPRVYTYAYRRPYYYGVPPASRYW